MQITLSNLAKLHSRACGNILKNHLGPFITQKEYEGLQGKFSEINGFRYSIERQLKKVK